MEWEIVTSVEHLKKLCAINGRAEFYLILAGGLCRSGKQIHYDEQKRKFEIYNEIDDSWQRDLSENGLYNRTIIPEAIQKGAMFYYGSQLWGID